MSDEKNDLPSSERAMEAHTDVPYIALRLNRKKICHLIGLLLPIFFFAFLWGILPVLMTGDIESIPMKPYNQKPFFVLSCFAVMIFPTIIILTLRRLGTVYLYQDRVVLKCYLGSLRIIFYSQMHVLLEDQKVNIYHVKDIEQKKWLQLQWIMWAKGIGIPLPWLQSMEDVPRTVALLKEKAFRFEDLRSSAKR